MLERITTILAPILILGTILCLPLYLVRFSVFGLPTNVLDFLLFGSFVTALSLAHSRGQLSQFFCVPRWILWAFALILTGTMLSLLFNDGWLIGLGIIKSWFLLPFFFFLSAAFLLSSRVVTPTHLLRALLVGGGFIALGALLFAGFGDGVTFDHRLRGFYLSPNHLAMALAPLLPLSFASIFFAWRGHYQRSSLLFSAATFLLLLITLLLTRSFGGIIAGFSGIALTALFLFRSQRVFLWTTFSAVFGLLLFILLLWQTPRIQDFFTIPERSSLASRAMIWQAAWDIGADHPAIGIGPGQFQDMYLAYQPRYEPYLEWAVPQPHNVFFAFWLQSGVLGLIGFLAICGFVFRAVYHSLKTANYDKNVLTNLCASAGFIVILLHGLIDTPYWKNDLSVLFWLLLLLVIASQILSTTNKKHAS